MTVARSGWLMVLLDILQQEKPWPLLIGVDGEDSGGGEPTNYPVILILILSRSSEVSVLSVSEQWLLWYHVTG